MDSHWINVGLPLDWTSKFDPTNHRTRAPGPSIKYVRAEGEGGVEEMTNFCVR